VRWSVSVMDARVDMSRLVNRSDDAAAHASCLHDALNAACIHVPIRSASHVTASETELTVRLYTNDTVTFTAWHSDEALSELGLYDQLHSPPTLDVYSQLS